MKITYENGWEYTDIHVDLPVPYEDNYQMRMLRVNEIPGLAAVKGSGLNGSSRYTYRISNGISIGRKYETGEMKKEDIRSLLEALLKTAEALAAYMLSPDGLILTPEMIYTPLTEYFVGRLDYHDTEGIFLVYKLHKETMKDSYELRQILAECRQEEKEYRREIMIREKKNYKKEQEKTEDGVQPAKQPERPAAPEKKGFVKRTVSRFRTGRWGEWKDLITEMDEGGV